MSYRIFLFLHHQSEIEGLKMNLLRSPAFESNPHKLRPHFHWRGGQYSTPGQFEASDWLLEKKVKNIDGKRTDL